MTMTMRIVHATTAAASNPVMSDRSARSLARSSRASKSLDGGGLRSASAWAMRTARGSAVVFDSLMGVSLGDAEAKPQSRERALEVCLHGLAGDNERRSDLVQRQIMAVAQHDRGLL